MPDPGVADLKAMARRPVAVALALVLGTMWSAAHAQDLGEDPTYVRGTDPPRLLSRVAPIYPDDARRDSVDGVVLVSARVGRDGLVREVQIRRSIPGLDEAAATAARRYQFRAARRDGLDCEAWVLVPVRFDDSLPRGAYRSTFVPVEQTRADQDFLQDVASVQDAHPAIPGPDESEVRRRIMEESLWLDVIPPPGDDALLAFARGDTSGWRRTPEGHNEARAQWTLAAQLAPWWPAPYLRLAAALIADRDYVGAARCARIALAGRPDDPAAEALLRRAGESRQGEAAAAMKNRK